MSQVDFVDSKNDADVVVSLSANGSAMPTVFPSRTSANMLVRPPKLYVVFVYYGWATIFRL